MRIAVALSLALTLPISAGTAFATCREPACGNTSTQTRNTNVNLNKNRAAAKAQANATSIAASHSTSNSGSSSNSNVAIHGNEIPDNTPDIGLAVPPATSPCRIPVGAGGSSPGLGLTIGFSTLDEGCDTREDARTLWAVGLQGAAYARLCQKPEMAKAMGTLCLREEQAPAPVSSVTFTH